MASRAQKTFCKWLLFAVMLSSLVLNEGDNAGQNRIIHHLNKRKIELWIKFNEIIYIPWIYYDRLGKKKIMDIKITNKWFVDLSDSSAAGICLLRSGDIELNPGPVKCGTCVSFIDDAVEDSICCSMCANWSHKICSKLNDDEFKIMSQSKMYWICNICGPNISSNDKLSAIEQKLVEFGNDFKKIFSYILIQEEKNEVQEKEITKIKLKQTSLEENLKVSNNMLMEVKEKMNNLSDKFAILEEKRENGKNSEAENNNSRLNINKNDSFNNNKEMKADLAKEILVIKEKYNKQAEINQREKNVMIFNVNEDKDILLQNKHDRECMEKLLKFLEIECDYKEIKISRIGKYVIDKKRPIKMECGSRHIKWEIVKNGKKLRESSDDNIKGLFVTLDKTIEERLEDKLLYAEYKIRKRNGEDIYIKNRKIYETVKDGMTNEENVLNI